MARQHKEEEAVADLSGISGDIGGKVKSRHGEDKGKVAR